MTDKDEKRLSKFLSYVLRHKPGDIGLQLDAEGWADVEELMRRAACRQIISRELLEQVVINNDKKRFEFSADGARIRARQGHSLDIDLGLEATLPPNQLFHGTASRFLDAILAEGLRKMQRHHVHLSGDLETASAVGRRYGKLVLLTVDARAMAYEGYPFFLSANGVWLTDHVPARFLQQLD